MFQMSYVLVSFQSGTVEIKTHKSEKIKLFWNDILLKTNLDPGITNTSFCIDTSNLIKAPEAKFTNFVWNLLVTFISQKIYFHDSFSFTN